MNFLNKLKKYSVYLFQILVLIVPIAQLTDTQFVIETLGKFGVHGLIASILAGYIVAWAKKSPVADVQVSKKEAVLEERETRLNSKEARLERQQANLEDKTYGK